MANYFTSDQHFDHKKILEYCPNRGFSSLEEQEEAFIARHNGRVNNDDFVWHLGDFSMRPATVERILPKLKGRHQLIAGNHDHVWKFTPDRIKRYQAAGFETVGRFGLIDLGPTKIRVLMSHLPYAPCEHDTDADKRYPHLRPTDNGGYLLHGHEHGKYKMRRRMIDVGVDVWNGVPVHEDVIVAMILDREAFIQASEQSIAKCDAAFEELARS